MNEVTNNYTSTDVMSNDITKLIEAQMKLTDEFSKIKKDSQGQFKYCLLYTSPSPRDVEESRMPSSA